MNTGVPNSHGPRVRDFLSGNRRLGSAASAELLEQHRAALGTINKGLAAQRKIADDPATSAFVAKEARTSAELLKAEFEWAQSALRALERRHADLVAARPAILKEAAAALKERDAVAAKLRQAYPEYAAAIIEMSEAAERSSRRLLAVAATGEVDIELTSAEAKAFGLKIPIQISGDRTGDDGIFARVVLPRPDGKGVMKPTISPVDAADVPARVKVRNAGSAPAGVHTAAGFRTVEPGVAIEAEFLRSELSGLLGQPGIVIAVP
jgi:hypothetical protein